MAEVTATGVRTKSDRTAELVVLTAILASIPVALPATYTLASALGARALAKLGVLPTRLSAVDEAATLARSEVCLIPSNVPPECLPAK